MLENLKNVSCTMDSDQEEEAYSGLLEKRHLVTQSLQRQPYDLIAYLERAAVHSDLGYPDLAAGDSYRALLLCDECSNEGFEYHQQALGALYLRTASGTPPVLRKRHSDRTEKLQTINVGGEEQRDKIPNIIRQASIRCYQNLAISLLLCGCLKSSYDFCTRGLAVSPQDQDLSQAKGYIEQMAKRRLQVDEIDINELPDQGLVRREIYPWNDHEPDRFSQETLDFLNAELAETGSKCEVKVTELPVLLEVMGNTDGYENIPTNRQLGLFATTDFQPGETVLHEFSLLAANNRLKETFCDACSSNFPPLDDNSTVVACPNCDDIMFCDENCLNRAQEQYHPAVCDKDVDTIAKDPDPKEKTFALYLLLLSRTLAMAETQNIHPLKLKEVKYIWGDFLPSAMNAVSLSINAPPPPVWTLPFSFQYNISDPLHVLERMEIDIYTTVDLYDLWIFNTLYAKFRGTASARVNERNGHPEVAAVHPLWCLANHDCDPNVQWEWGGRMKLWCREKRISGKPGGIKEGEEILNHYCDIDLKVKDRREWASGSLGGSCMCGRCRREAAEEEAGNGMVNGNGNENGHQETVSGNSRMVNGFH